MLLITMSIWGSTFVVTKHAIGMLPPLELAFARVALGAIVLLPFAWALGGGVLVAIGIWLTTFRSEVQI
jgi:drug/metabolite transporter (DMT)-like permease